MHILAPCASIAVVTGAPIDAINGNTVELTQIATVAIETTAHPAAAISFIPCIISDLLPVG